MPIATGQIKNPTKVHHEKGTRGPWDSYHFEVVWENGNQKVEVDPRTHMSFWENAGKDDKWYNVTYSGQYNKTDDIAPAKIEDIKSSGDKFPPPPGETVRCALITGKEVALALFHANEAKFADLMAEETYIKDMIQKYADIAADWMKRNA